jgi:Clp amino terminal domain, pathogenicity island component
VGVAPQMVTASTLEDQRKRRSLTWTWPFGPLSDGGATSATSVDQTHCMYDRFSDAARTVVAAAEREAFTRGSSEVEPEDVLVVLAGFDGVAGSVLRAVAADPALLREAVTLREASTLRDRSTGPAAERTRPLSLSSATATSFTIAIREADGLRLPFVATEHLLLGLLREPAGRTTALLLAVRRDPGLVRERLLDLLSSPGFVSPEAPLVATPPPLTAVAASPAPVNEGVEPVVSLDEFDRELLETVLDEVSRLRAEIAMLRSELAGVDSQDDRNIA